MNQFLVTVLIEFANRESVFYLRLNYPCLSLCSIFLLDKERKQACASSTNALIDAFNYIKWNKAWISFTYDQATYEAKIYIDGLVVSSGYYSNALSTYNAYPLTFGTPTNQLASRKWRGSSLSSISII